MNLQWNVYYHDFNRDRLAKFNLFDHGSFCNYFEKIRKEFRKTEDKEGFADRIKSELRYYYWSKCEWEVVITKNDSKIIMSPWVGSRNNPELDVTDEIDFDWTGFYDKMSERHVNRNGSIKIDVYEQVMYRWDEFIDYCWKECKRDRRKKN